jgi:hypothetical protein
MGHQPHLSDERGQATGLAVVFLVAVLGMAALVIDVGSWFRADRAAQAAADAAALAAAQVLPSNPGAAPTIAVQYANENGGGLDIGRVELLGDTVRVEVERGAPGFFSRALGFSAVEVAATAAARAAAPVTARYAAPFVVDETHPLLTGGGCPCWNQGTDLDLQRVAPGNFKIVNLDNTKGGIGPTVLSDWILNGYDGFLPLGWYYGDPGAKFNPSQITSALDARIGSELLFPVYRGVQATGSNVQYEIVAWAVFHLSGYKVRGSSGSLQGWFVSMAWEGIQSTAGGGPPYYGAHTVSLIE